MADSLGIKSVLDKILDRVLRDRKIDFRRFRRPLLGRRLAARMSRLGLDDPAAYLERFESDPAEMDLLIDTFAINVSAFFRDPLPFEFLAGRIIPDLLEKKRNRSKRELRIWSAGCGRGEEAYSAAILLHDALSERKEEWEATVFATDINEVALEALEAGHYPRESLRNVKLDVFDRHFTPVPAGFAVKPPAKDLVRWSFHDLTSQDAGMPPDSVFGGFDVVLCRNVTIYYPPAAQRVMQKNICRSLDDGGFLILGEAEALGTHPRMETVDARARIYRKRPAGGSR